MVTRIVTLRIKPAERASASAAEDSNRDDDHQLQNKKRNDHDDDYNKYDTKEDDDEIQFGNINEVGLSKAADGGFCEGNSKNCDVSSHCKPNDDTINDGKAADIRRHDANTSKKRPLLLEGAVDDNGKEKRQKKSRKFIDLTDVPPQSPIHRSDGKDGASKYQGAYFNKTMNKWQARISIDGKRYRIGAYDTEEEAAVDYARAVFKYKKKSKETEKKKKSKETEKFIDLTDVPQQSLILRSGGKDGASKYHGVTFIKKENKWRAQISIDRKYHHIGTYENEEEAAIDYARAVLKYKLGGVKGKREQNIIDLTDVPPKSPLLKSKNCDASKYQGVYFDKTINKWQARISIDGNTHTIGYYENEEEAAVDYARAVFKYNTVRKEKFIDLTDVPPRSPIFRSGGKDGASKYQGITHNKMKNKWQAQIMVGGKHHSIGYYENEEEAAVDYARAVFKYDAVRKKKFIDLTDVPPRSPILRSGGKDGASKYQGVTFAFNKWQARITIDGKQHTIGCYENEEEAAVDYARAVFKYNAVRAEAEVH